MLKRRRSRSTGVVGIIAAVAAGAGLWGASAGATASSHSADPTGKAAASGVTIDFVCATPAVSPFFAPIESGAQDAGTAMGVNLSYTGISNTITGPAMAQVLQAAVNQKPSALIFCNFFPTEDSIAKAASRAGIPVFVTNSITDAVKDGALSSFAAAGTEPGVAAGKEMLAAGVKHPLCVDDVPTNPSVAAWCTGFAAAFKAKGIKAQTDNLPADDNNNPTGILAATKGALEANTKIDGVLALGNAQVVAVAQAVADTGRASKIKVGGFNISSQVLSDIQNGSILFTVWQQPYLEGYLPVVAAALHAKYGMYPVGYTATGPVVVTKQNLAIVQAAEAKGDA
jgi:simple sugar transport system substrate-binding protein